MRWVKAIWAALPRPPGRAVQLTGALSVAAEFEPPLGGIDIRRPTTDLIVFDKELEHPRKEHQEVQDDTRSVSTAQSPASAGGRIWLPDGFGGFGPASQELVCVPRHG